MPRALNGPVSTHEMEKHMAQLICLVYSWDITNVLLIHYKGTTHEWFFKWANWVMTLQCLNNRVHYSKTTKTSSALVAGCLKSLMFF